MTGDELVGRLEALAAELGEGQPHARLVLAALCGALTAGSERALGEAVADWCRREMARVDRLPGGDA
jgi:hypothetical protein